MIKFILIYMLLNLFFFVGKCSEEVFTVVTYAPQKEKIKDFINDLKNIRNLKDKTYAKELEFVKNHPYPVNTPLDIPKDKLLKTRRFALERALERADITVYRAQNALKQACDKLDNKKLEENLDTSLAKLEHNVIYAKYKSKLYEDADKI
jgi:hypothetical protein